MDVYRQDLPSEPVIPHGVAQLCVWYDSSHTRVSRSCQSTAVDRHDTNNNRLRTNSKMKHLVFIFFVLFGTVLNAQSDIAIIEQIAQATAQTKSLTCDFVQKRSSRLMSDPVISTGRMAYERRERLRWEYTTPRELVFIMNSGKAYIKKDGRKTLLDAARSKAFRKISTLIMSCVTGQGLTDSKTFHTTVKQESGKYILTMTPRQKDLQRMYSSITLHYNPKLQAVDQVEMQEKNGDMTQIEMTKIMANAKLSPDTF